jgi:hypothetical protein
MIFRKVQIPEHTLRTELFLGVHIHHNEIHPSRIIKIQYNRLARRARTPGPQDSHIRFNGG